MADLLLKENTSKKPLSVLDTDLLVYRTYNKQENLTIEKTFGILQYSKIMFGKKSLIRQFLTLAIFSVYGLIPTVGECGGPTLFILVLAEQDEMQLSSEELRVATTDRSGNQVFFERVLDIGSIPEASQLSLSGPGIIFRLEKSKIHANTPLPVTVMGLPNPLVSPILVKPEGLANKFVRSGKRKIHSHQLIYIPTRASAVNLIRKQFQSDNRFVWKSGFNYIIKLMSEEEFLSDGEFSEMDYRIMQAWAEICQYYVKLEKDHVIESLITFDEKLLKTEKLKDVFCRTAMNTLSIGGINFDSITEKDKFDTLIEKVRHLSPQNLSISESLLEFFRANWSLGDEDSKNYQFEEVCRYFDTAPKFLNDFKGKNRQYDHFLQLLDLANELEEGEIAKQIFSALKSRDESNWAAYQAKFKARISRLEQ